MAIYLQTWINSENVLLNRFTRLVSGLIWKNTNMRESAELFQEGEKKEEIFRLVASIFQRWVFDRDSDSLKSRNRSTIRADEPWTKVCQVAWAIRENDEEPRPCYYDSMSRIFFSLKEYDITRGRKTVIKMARDMQKEKKTEEVEFHLLCFISSGEASSLLRKRNETGPYGTKTSKDDYISSSSPGSKYSG